MRLVRAALLVAVTGCAAARREPIDRAAPGRAPLAIQVVYPDTAVPIQARDSSFLFGTVGAGRGDATLTIDGRPVTVHPNGTWLAWLPLPDDTLARFQLVARAGSFSRETTFVTRIAPRFRPPAPPDSADGRAPVPWIDTTSFTPTDTILALSGEGIRLAVRAAPGSQVQLRTDEGDVVPFVANTLAGEPSAGVRAFATDSAAYRLPPAIDRYVAWLPARPLCDAVLEVVLDGDTVRSVWPLVVDTLDRSRPLVVRLDDDTARTGRTDSLTVGKAVPYGTYHWFFPLGTMATMSGRWRDQVRLQLSQSAVAWVNAPDVVPLPPGTPPPGGTVGSVRLSAGANGSLVLRVPLPAPLPFQIEEGERRLTLRVYGVGADINWMQHGGSDLYVTRMSFAQPAADETTITLSLSGRVWGYRTRWSGRDLLLEIRRPPAIERRRPLAGRTIVLDPGHPPAGSKGPSGLPEAVVTLAVAVKAKSLLERGGARVLLTRTDSTPLDLFPRTRFAELLNADVLVSIHANALPDGINPFINNGTSVYYFHPRGAALARALDRALVAELGVRDLGIGRGDYALARNPWMPSALAEGLFMMIPEQEAMLASEDGQWRYARGIARGIEEFLRAMSR
ncbi:MAG: N-acetylmuramoyl-L-alanine amidase [Gemmatimonadales bacterium]|nr:N-acetylmuramoyl-L-alanine amidase [Gemmatimonadales bacterium]